MGQRPYQARHLRRHHLQLAIGISTAPANLHAVAPHPAAPLRPRDVFAPRLAQRSSVFPFLRPSSAAAALAYRSDPELPGAVHDAPAASALPSMSCDPWPATRPPDPCSAGQAGSATSGAKTARSSAPRVAEPHRSAAPGLVPPVAHADIDRRRESWPWSRTEWAWNLTSLSLC